jgi:hypothetical protein
MEAVGRNPLTAIDELMEKQDEYLTGEYQWRMRGEDWESRNSRFRWPEGWQPGD